MRTTALGAAVSKSCLSNLTCWLLKADPGRRSQRPVDEAPLEPQRRLLEGLVRAPTCGRGCCDQVVSRLPRREVDRAGAALSVLDPSDLSGTPSQTASQQPQLTWTAVDVNVRTAGFPRFSRPPSRPESPGQGPDRWCTKRMLSRDSTPFPSAPRPSESKSTP
jgi:hypothetical protein